MALLKQRDDVATFLKTMVCIAWQLVVCDVSLVRRSLVSELDRLLHVYSRAHITELSVVVPRAYTGNDCQLL